RGILQLRGPQKLVVSLTNPLRPGPIAFPENNPPKSITFSRSFRLRTSACSRIDTLSVWYSVVPSERFTDSAGRTRPRSKFTRLITSGPYVASASSSVPVNSNGNPLSYSIPAANHTRG